MKQRSSFLLVALIIVAVFAAALGQNKEAPKNLSALRAKVVTSPKNAQAWLALGAAYLNAGKPDSAEYAGKQVVGIDKKISDGHILISKALVAQKNTIAATTSLRKALKTLRNNSSLLTELGLILLASDSVDKAIVYFSQAKEADPNDARAYAVLGDAYEKMGTTSMAILQYEKSLELDSLHADVQHKLARAYVKSKRYNDAARMYRNVIAADSANEEAIGELGKIYFAAKQYTNAAHVYQSYVQREPNSQSRWVMLMESLYLGKHYTDAQSASKRVLQFDPESKRALKIHAHSSYELKQYDQAVESYTKLARTDTLGIDNLRRLGKAYAESKQDQLAANVLEEVIKKDSTQKEVFTDLGAVYMRLQKYDRAAEMFEKRFSLDPTAVSAYLNYSLSNMAMGKWDLARMGLRKAVALKPEYLQGHVFLGRCLMQIDSLQQSKHEYEVVVTLADTQQTKYKNELGEAHRMIGFVHLMDKKFPQAVESLTRSLRFKHDDVQSHLLLAQSYALMNKREEALKEYQFVLKLDPKNETAKKDIEKLGLQQ